MFASAQLILAALLATPPPIFAVDRALDDAWAEAASDFAACSAKAAAAKRAGTAWVDLVFPKFNYPFVRTPTWTLRKSPGLLAADQACVSAVVARKVVPGMTNISHYSYGVTITKELALGTITRYLPPLAGFLPLWREVARAPSDPTRRARLARQVRPLASVERDGCLIVRQEERLQAARRDWLAAAGRPALESWQPLADRLGQSLKVKEPTTLLLDDGDVLLAGIRLDERTGRRHAPPAWSLRNETYCLHRIEATRPAAPPTPPPSPVSH